MEGAGRGARARVVSNPAAREARHLLATTDALVAIASMLGVPLAKADYFPLLVDEAILGSAFARGYLNLRESTATRRRQLDFYLGSRPAVTVGRPAADDTTSSRSPRSSLAHVC